MLKNYFKIAYRKLWKEKTSTAISVLGLATGMACCMLIVLFIRDELGFNTFNERQNDIYCLNWTTKQPDGTISTEATSPLPFAPAIAPQVAGIKYAARLYQRSGEMQAGNAANVTRFQEQQVYFADSTLFNIFSIPFVDGTGGNNALAAPNSVVITDEMAAKYFGTASAVGKTLLYEDKQLLQVTGVVKKMPSNSDLQFDFLVSLETLYGVENKDAADFIKTNWTFTASYTYLLLKHGQQVAGIEKQLNQLLKKDGNDRNRQMNTVSLQPLKKIHLYSADVVSNLSSNSITYVYIFAAIALLILFIANVNFINLAIAQSVSRTREVGMRKVLGAGKKQLITQFLGETLLVSFVAFAVAFFLAGLGLPLLNQLTNKQLSWHLFFSLQNVLLFTGIFLMVSICAGLYPAFFISRFKPAISIKGKTGERVQRNTVRKALLVAQFAISTGLIIGAIIIYQQLQYLRNKPLGFQKQQMVVVPLFGSNASTISNGVDGPMRKRMNTFSTELLRNSKIKAVTSASALPGQGIVSGLVIPQGFADNSNIFVPWISVDYNFLQALNIPLAAGRSFSRATGTDHLSAFIINESALHTFNWKSPHDAIGKTIIRGEATNGKRGQVIGVIKDFNFTSLDQPMQPLILDVNAPRFTQFAVNVQADHLPETIEYIKTTWNKFFPERVFEYSFLDNDIDKLYADKENLSRIIEYFALIAILLSCSGLFSIAAFLSAQRTKEIGIRKVLGAGVTGILVLLSKEFVKLVLIAFVIALPLIWYVMHKWLQNFAYRINIAWWVFAGAGMFVLLLALITVGFQSIKAALMNPVKSLRVE
jgi:putative ABC transport system permease protein